MHPQNAASAYNTVATSVLGPRAIEQRVFQQTNGRLMAVRDDPELPFRQVAEAIHVNTQLWTMLAADIFSEQNTLPDALRGQLASLAIYAQKTGRAVLRREATVEPLIELNRAMIAGLDGDPGIPARQVQ